MNKFEVKQLIDLSPDQLFELEENERIVFDESGLNRYYLPVIARYGFLFALYAGDKIIGLTSFICKDKTSFLVGFWILEDHRSRGLRSLLLRESMIKLKESGYKSVELTVKEDNDAARALYKKNGFEYIEKIENFYGPLESRILLRAYLLK